MNKLNRTIAEYFRASSDRDYVALTALFRNDASVEDEGRTHTGIDAIRKWVENTQAEYSFELEPLSSKDEEGTTVVSCRVSGGFPGSPIELRFRFTLKGERIASLTIRD